MTSKKLVFIAALAGSLVLSGAGCQGKQYAAPADLMNNEPAPSGAISKLTVPGVQPEAVTGSAAAQPAPPPAADTQAVQDDRPPKPASFPGILPAKELANKRAVIATDKGTIVFEILGGEGPRAASNFIVLARSGFYDGLKFHRVEQGFVIQGGDPLGNGTGGPGYKFEDDPVSLDYAAGIVAMANSGPDTNGSQFFVVLEDQPFLPKSYSIFGRVTQGLDVARRISVGDTMRSVVIEDAE